MNSKVGQREGPCVRDALRVGRALALVWRSGRGWAVASALLQVGQGALPLLALWLTAGVVDAVAGGSEAAAAALHGRLLLLVALLGTTALAGTLCNSLAGFVREAQALRVTAHVLDLLQAKATEVDLECYEDPRYHDALYRARQEAPYRPTRVVDDLARVGRGAVALLGVAGLLCSYHWAVALLLFAAAVPGVLVRLRYARREHRWRRRQTPTYRQAFYLDAVLTGDGHAKELRLFELGLLFRRRFRALLRRLRRAQLRFFARRCGAETAAQSCAAGAVVVVGALLAFRAARGAVTLGALVLYYQAFQKGQEFLREMLGGLAALYEDNLFLTSLYEFLDRPPKVLEPACPVPIPAPMRCGIVFRSVSFQYAGATRKALDGIDVTIRPGEIVAVVGENGSGKSTLLKLLCRLYDPTEGAITVDGIDLRNVSLAAWRRQVSVLFQDYARYHLTAWENIWLGDAGSPPDRERIQVAARQAGADVILGRLGGGYDTLLGRWFEEGEELSIGGWQRVALARALLRRTQVVVLDEPTSSVDARTEEQVFARFRALAAGRAALLITHRLATARLADRIYVLEGGRLVESGSHDDLCRRGAAYSQLFNQHLVGVAGEPATVRDGAAA